MPGQEKDRDDQRLGVKAAAGVLKPNKELSLLDATAALAAVITDPHSLTKACAAMLADVLAYDVVMVYFFDPEANEFVATTARGASPQLLSHITKAINQDYINVITREKGSMFIDDIDADSVWQLGKVAQVDHEVAAIGGVPLVSQERLMGVLLVATFQTHGFSESEKLVLTCMGKIIGIALDNSRLHNELVHNKIEWGSILDAMTDGISIHDAEFTITRVNKALARMFGTTKDKLIGRKCYELFHGTNGPIENCPHQKAMETASTAYLRLQEPYLGNCIFSVSADPLFDSGGQVVGSVHDVRDITAQENIRSKLAEYERFKSMGEMAGGVAHDFNNYLNVVLGNIDLLLEQDGLKEQSRQEVHSIQQAILEAATTVRRLQEIGKIKTGEQFAAVDLNQVIQAVLKTTEVRWKHRPTGSSISVRTDLPPLPPAWGVEVELKEVLTNLILNAVDAMPGGGELTIATSRAGDQLIINLSDTGVGMEEAVRRRVFEPFFTTKGEEGSGLGLSVAYSIITRHGGEISVESKAGVGSLFTINLPLAQPVAAQLGPLQPLSPRRVPGGTARVLAIEDQMMVRTLLSGILEGAGYEVKAVEAAEEGLRRFEERLKAGQPFDLVIADLSLPTLSGWELARRIKRLSPGTGVVLTSGWDEQLDPRKIKEFQVDAILSKPFHVAEVQSLVGKLLSSS